MTAELATYDALSADSALAALVDDRISPDELDDDDELPALVFERADTEPIYNLETELQGSRVTMRLTAWAKSRKQANAVATAATDAMHAAGYPQQERSTAFEPDLQEYATVVTFEVFEI